MGSEVYTSVNADSDADKFSPKLRRDNQRIANEYIDTKKEVYFVPWQPYKSKKLIV